MSDCSPANRERELGLDRREAGEVHLTKELDVATVIELSTRGTVRSDIWLMRLAETLVPRCYHLPVYD